MPKPKPPTIRETDDDHAHQMVRAVRDFVGDDDAPLSNEEAAHIAEIKARYGRPTTAEIKARAKRLAR